MYRKTYAEINLKNIKSNVTKLVSHLNEYKYHIGVVKADCYGHGGIDVVSQIIDGGCNYLAVATLEEALEIRKHKKRIPILCLGTIASDNINICKKKNIAITIPSLEYLDTIDIKQLKKTKVHIKINTGMNRLGVSSQGEFDLLYNVLKEKTIKVEGIYTHIYNDSNKKDTQNQINRFRDITCNVNLEDIKIIHFGASGYSLKYPKLDFVNGCRLGIAIYGLVENNINLKSTFSLYSTVIQINEVENETVGYCGMYRAKGKEKIAVVPIGYADGIIRKNTGRKVFINNKEYPIVGNICMDMLFIKVDDAVKIGDKVVLIKDINHIQKIAKHLDTIHYEVICSIGKRIPRIYK